MKRSWFCPCCSKYLKLSAHGIERHKRKCNADAYMQTKAKLGRKEK